MANQFLMEILTPERSFYCDTIDAVIVPAPDGDMSIHKGHENMVLYLVPGEMRILKDKKWQFCSVADGFVEIRPDETIIFTQAAEWPEEIDVHRAQQEKLMAEEKLRQKLSEKEYRQNKILLAKTMARLALSKKKIKL